ncbi:hypothetical protein A9Q86_14575 [Flavobacteriales bacterium 33_180_T64]|nr:hypothetical protein A9Q86_14575 [Flavobacteriales bacterium 33_180_T64]
MKLQQYFTLKEVQLNNNCPECYSNNGLELTFKQRFIENLFYKAITKDIINKMHCNTCSTDIFPVQWTDDIEQIVAYQKRAVKPKPKSTKMKKSAWIIVVSGVLLLVAIILFITEILSF